MKKTHLIFYSISAGFVTAMFGMTSYFYNQLPAEIPTHFNFFGQADAWAPKNIVMSFLIPLLALLIFLLFSLLYRHPEYTSWPTTLILLTVEESKREKVFAVLRSMNAYILLWITVLFTYLQFLIIATANQRSIGYTAQIMAVCLAAIFVIILVTNIRMLTTVYKMIRSKK